MNVLEDASIETGEVPEDNEQYQRGSFLTFSIEHMEAAEDVTRPMRHALRHGARLCIQSLDCPRGIFLEPGLPIPKDVAHDGYLLLDRARRWARYQLGRDVTIIHPADLSAALHDWFGQYQSNCVRMRGRVKEFL